MTKLAQNTFTVKRAAKDGYSCSLSSYSVMLNADSSGVVNGLSAASTTVKLYQGSTAVTPVISIDSTSNCSAGISGLNVSIVSVPNNSKSGYVDIKIVYGGFVKIERYTFTVVDYTIVKNYTQTIVGDQMTNYATKATVDALGNTVSDQSTKIQQNANAISSTVSSVDKLSNRVSTAETAISQLPGQIALKASQSDVTALGNRMTSAEAKITPDAINLTVKSQVDNAVGNVQIGARNYAVGTSSLWYSTTQLVNIANQCPSLANYVKLDGLKVGDVVYISFDYYQQNFVDGGNAHIRIQGAGDVTGWKGNTFPGINIPFVSGTVIRHFAYKYTIQSGDLQNNNWQPNIRHDYISGTVAFRNFMVGRSTNEVDWSPAPEDVDANIALRPTTDEIKASFTIDTGGISMLGKKISLVGMVTFSSLASDAQNKINTAQSTADSANSAAGKAQSTADAKASTTYVDNAKGAAISAAASDASNKANGALSSAKGYTDSLKGSLGALAWEKAVGLAKLDNTIIDGGFIKTNLIDAVKIVAQGISAQTIDAGNATIKNLNVDTVKMTNADVSGKITAASGAIGFFSIDNNGLYFGDPAKWRTSAYKQDLASIVPGCIKIQKQIGYFQPGDIANIKVGIGDGADPSVNPTGSSFCTSAGYFYRQMNSSTDPYFPAVRIISDNVVNRNIALETIGGIRAKNGMIDMGRLMYVGNMNATNVIDLSFGTSIVIKNTMNGFSFFLPTLSQVRAQLGITSSESFCIPIRIGIDKSSQYGIYLKTQNKANPPASDAEGGMLANNDGGEWQNSSLTMAKGDVARFSLTYTPYAGYYAQLDTWFN